MVPVLDAAACLVDDLRNFLSDVADRPDDPSRPLLPTEEAEEELEWISNKDAFPAVETFILSEQVGGIAIAKHQSPVSVLETSTNSSSASLMSSCGGLKPPHRARTKGRRRRSEIPPQQLFWNQPPIESSKPGRSSGSSASKLDIGRKCLHCGTDQTPQWRAGPHGPKTLCNACGVRYKSGRLCPEYRPASSPTFSSEMHSNSHRKVLEMRKHKYGVGMVVKPEDKVFKSFLCCLDLDVMNMRREWISLMDSRVFLGLGAIS